MVEAGGGGPGGVAGFEPAFFQVAGSGELAQSQRVSVLSSIVVLAILALAAVLVVFAFVAYSEPKVSPALQRAARSTPDSPVQVVLVTALDPCEATSPGLDGLRRLAGNDFTAVQPSGGYCLLSVTVPAERVEGIAASWDVSSVRTVEELREGAGGLGMWGGAFARHRDTVLVLLAGLILALLAAWYVLERRRARITLVRSGPAAAPQAQTVAPQGQWPSGRAQQGQAQPPPQGAR